jgi:hypothetical protein
LNRTTCPGQPDTVSVYQVTGQSDGHGTLLKECVSGCPVGQERGEDDGMTVVWSQQLYRKGRCPGLSSFRARRKSRPNASNRKIRPTRS